jgi:cell division protein FtsI/penicillin-binding protein 2
MDNTPDIIRYLKQVHNLQAQILQALSNVSHDQMDKIGELTKRIEELTRQADVTRMNVNHTLEMVSGLQEIINKIESSKNLYTGEKISEMRASGLSWSQISGQTGIKECTLKKRYEKYKKEILESLE